MKWYHVLFVFYLALGFYLKPSKDAERIPASNYTHASMKDMAKSGGY